MFKCSHYEIRNFPQTHTMINPEKFPATHAKIKFFFPIEWLRVLYRLSHCVEVITINYFSRFPFERRVSSMFVNATMHKFYTYLWRFCSIYVCGEIYVLFFFFERTSLEFTIILVSYYVIYMCKCLFLKKVE